MERLKASPFSDGFTFALELTSKIWKSRDPAEIERVCRELFRVWARPIARCDHVVLCMSIGNGEHILKWSGNMEDVFARDIHIGHNNAKYAFDENAGVIPLALYMENPPAFTYGDLLLICQTLKRVCLEQCGRPCHLATNFEPGPEFCESTFKYVEHPEILNWQGNAHGSSIAFDGILHADTYRYAAYPNGIPEGEPFSRFLGKQLRSFFETFGYEMISFSNGLGFGTFPWSLNGRNFDGKQFGLVDFREEADSMCQFWEMLRENAPYPAFAQGTNWPIGADLATKCIPFRDYYDRKYLCCPLANTVSVFFNDSVGFSMQALLGRASYADSFRAFFYLNDMWYPQDPFENYPYDGEPYDLYIPASMSHIDSNGKHTALRCMAIGSANDHTGSFREDTFVKFLPHYERALDHLPDTVGPLTQLYPFEEYHDAAESSKQLLPMLYFTDCYTATAIDSGLPLNSVCSTSNFAAALQQGSLQDTILYTTLPIAGSAYCKDLIRYIEEGGRVLFVGSVQHADPAVLDLLGLSPADPIDGELTVAADPSFEAIADEPLSGKTVLHLPIDSDGGVSAVANGCTMLVSVEKNGVQRAYVTERTIGKGKAVWVRGSLPFSIPDGENIVYHPQSYLSAPRFVRYALSRFGWKIEQKFSAKSAPAQLMMWRHDNALYFTGYAPDNTLNLGLSTPYGAPLLPGYTCEMQGDTAWYHIPTTPWKPCRIFAKQNEGRIRCRHVYNSRKFKHDTYALTGLNDADLQIRIPRAYWDEVELLINANDFTVMLQKGELTQLQAEKDDTNCVLSLYHVSGNLQISW